MKNRTNKKDNSYKKVKEILPSDILFGYYLSNQMDNNKDYDFYISDKKENLIQIKPYFVLDKSINDNFKIFKRLI